MGNAGSTHGPLPAGQTEGDVAEFTRPEAIAYLDSASMGLAPRSAIAAMASAMRAWQLGEASWMEWDERAQQCRQGFAAAVGAHSEEVALIPAVSIATALVASGVEPGGEVVVAADDFASVRHPLTIAGRRGAIRVRETSFASVADAITSDTRLVAVSHVHSKTGEVLDVAAVREAAHAAGAETFLDATQSIGVMPVDVACLGVDYLACAGYKWLCTPSGVAFFYVRRPLASRLVPTIASWHATADPYSGFFGGALLLADGAARFDVSPAWFSWVGARASLDLLGVYPAAARFEIANGLACEAADLLALPRPRSAILAVPVKDERTAVDALAAAGVKAAVMDGHVRLAPHFYNTSEDVHRAAEALRGCLRAGSEGRVRTQTRVARTKT
jgi:selenocysteine lyase/cysteine desulfurase